LIITCSPIPSHPSPIVLKTVINSFHKYAHELLKCHLVIVFDGLKIVPESKEASKLGHVSEVQRDNYEIFIDQTTSFLKENWGRESGERNTSSTQSPITIPPISKTINNTLDAMTVALSDNSSEDPILTCLKVSGPRLGQALAVREALKFVNTPYTFACQHDWRLNQHIDLRALLNMMDERMEMNYLGFISRRTQSYHSIVHGRGFPPALVEPQFVETIPLCRSYFWFDKNHIARTSFYKNAVFSGRFKFKRGDFIEDTMGHQMMNEIKEGGIEAWKKWGAFLYYP
ncbi:hypothetical protein BDR26DRAFT_803417, partial [Obelidium mucronatum]